MINAEDRALNFRKVYSCVNQGFKSPPDLYMFMDIEQINRELRWKYEHKKYIDRHYGTGRKMQYLRFVCQLQD